MPPCQGLVIDVHPAVLVRLHEVGVGDDTVAHEGASFIRQFAGNRREADGGLVPPADIQQRSERVLDDIRVVIPKEELRLVTGALQFPEHAGKCMV
jgi:hypothetical protein